MIKLLCEKSGWSGGPKTFRDRIRPVLKKMPEISITGDENSKFDLELVFIRKKTRHKKPYVRRVDGVYYKKKRSAYYQGLLANQHMVAFFIWLAAGI